MRTALLTTNYPPRPTGLGRAAEAIAEGLTRCGVAVTVISADRAAGVSESVGSVTVVGCAVPAAGPSTFVRKRMAIGHLVAPAAFASAVRAVHRASPLDLVEATNWYAPAAFLVGGRALAGRAGAVPIVIRHSTPAGISTEAHSLRDRLDLRAAHALERRTAHRADGHIFNTRASRSVLESHYRLALAVPSAVIGLALDDALIAAGAAAPMPPPGEPLTLTFVGRAERRKGFVQALEAVAQIAATRPVRLHLVGVEPDAAESALRDVAGAARLEGRIHAHGRASDETLWRCYRDSHAVLAPSRSESYGIVYREAAAFGRPVIASSEDPSARQFIGETGVGILAERTEGGAIARAIETLFADGARAARCRDAGLRHAATLTRDRLGAATLDLYRAVLAAP